MRNRLGYYSNGHAMVVNEDCDWGGPCEYTPTCGCGWEGTTVGDVKHVDGSGVIGTIYDAYREGLAHLGYSVVDYLQASEAEISRYLANIVKCTQEITKIRDTMGAMRDMV